MKATPEMIAAGAEAARKYMEETGGNSPSVIWDAMWAAQQRTWVGLTDEEKKSMWVTSNTYLTQKRCYMLGVSDAEAKLKEKNT